MRCFYILYRVEKGAGTATIKENDKDKDKGKDDYEIGM